jgi:hypothetical protein
LRFVQLLRMDLLHISWLVTRKHPAKESLEESLQGITLIGRLVSRLT